MKSKINISIKEKIYWSFSLLVLLFVLNGIITILTINRNKNLSIHLSKVIDPSLLALDDFKTMMLESKMYTTNWVFLRAKESDKLLLRSLHDSAYPALKKSMNIYSSKWNDKRSVDSLVKVFAGFEQLLVIEKNIMESLRAFKDYDDPVIRFSAESVVEEEILPRTASLMNKLAIIRSFLADIRTEENAKVESSSKILRGFIIILAFGMILIGLFLSFYMSKVIIAPINEMLVLINDLSKGIIRKIDRESNSDELGRMAHSINNFSEKLQATATFAHETGLRNFDMPFKPLSDEDTLGKALVAMRENLRSGEVDLEIKNKELERKNKELEQFAFVASHDLQEPLRTISTFVELLQHQYKGNLDNKADKYLTYIIQASDRMRRLITDLLDYSKIGSQEEMQDLDCNIMLHEVLEDLGAKITETGAVIKTEKLPILNGYQVEMKQLFQNLIVNAIKFTSTGICPKIKISAERVLGHWQFAFSDNGIGIAKEHNEKIFIIFQRLHTRSHYQGSGIGLSHCKKIVELHKGKIWLESEVGEGTTFYFTIPLKHSI